MHLYVFPAALLSLVLAGAACADGVRAVEGVSAPRVKSPVTTPLVTHGASVPKTPVTPPGVPVPYPNAAAPKAGKRAYGLDRSAGAVRFGDGVRGRIPSPGPANANAAYRRGGGATGNLPAPAAGPREVPAVPALRLTPLDGGSLGEPVTPPGGSGDGD